MARIALDAMGGDHAPRATIAGALHALDELPGHTIQLVGQPRIIEKQLDDMLARDGGELAALAAHRKRIVIIDAPDVVANTDRPTAVLKRPTSSMAVGLKLQCDDQSDAFVSAGNTGAQMAASVMLLKLHDGLKRPAIATIFPTSLKPVVVLDSGANVDCSAEELVQFARIGVVYAETVLGRENPSVGLLSIGEEPEKGNAVTKEAHQRLVASGLNFQGNIEGRDLPTGRSDRGPMDVVVCDGFVGNVVLKFYEAVGPMIIRRLSAATGMDADKMRAALRDLDYSEYGGAPLLGVRGVSIISHGKSDARAIKNAIKAALRAHESGMNAQIGRRLAESDGVSAATV